MKSGEGSDTLDLNTKPLALIIYLEPRVLWFALLLFGGFQIE